MLRIVRRYVNKTCKALSFCRYEHSSPVRSSLKWEETQFNGVEVNLSQLEDNPNLDEFSGRLKGKFKFCKRPRLVIILRYTAVFLFNLMPLYFFVTVFTVFRTAVLIGDTIGKIFVYKHCFCHLNVQNVKEKNSLFHQPIVLWLAY